MAERLDRLRDAVRRPLPLGYHPLYRFYRGGALTRAFRGLPERPDDWWSEDWVGSCATALEVADEIDVSDGRFSIAIVVSGTGSIDGDFGSEPVRRGQTFALPASVPIRVRAEREAVRVIRCLGPAVA